MGDLGFESMALAPPAPPVAMPLSGKGASLDIIEVFGV